MKATKYRILVGLLVFCSLGLMLKAASRSQLNKPTLKQLKEEFIEQERERFKEHEKELEKLEELVKDPNSLISILMEAEFVSPLRGLKGIMVRVRVMDFEGGRRLGFVTQSGVRAAVERQLEEAGVKVFDKWLDKDLGQLLIEITVRKTTLARDNLTLCHFCISSSLLQAARLIRDPNICVADQTWKAPLSVDSFLADSAGFSGSVKIGTRIKNVVVLQTGDFIDAYLAANPKKPPKEQNEKKPEG